VNAQQHGASELQGASELLGLAKSIAIEAGELAARLRREGVEVANTKTSSVDVVTAADKAVEAFIRGRLATARPADGFLGEESTGSGGTSGLTWVVDPIDGTVNYLYKIPAWAISIAVVEGEPDPLTWTGIAGCVLNPTLGEVFSAHAGGGAFLGRGFESERRIQVAPAVDLSQALVATGFSYQSTIRSEQAAVLQELLPRVRDIRRGGSAALDLCFVASGRVNAYFERMLNPWDHAAGAIIAREAGASVTGKDGAAPSNEFTLAAHPVVADALRSVLDESRA
jgi:myo-inositol-1(or 4)-monophosphatase